MTSRSGRDDRSPASSRQPPRLDHEQVVAGAESVVDELGWDGLTMAALALRLGTKGPSLYNHVASLDELRSELQQRTMLLLGRELTAAIMGRAGPDSFFAIAHAYRAFAQRYPHRYDGATRPPIDRGAFAAAAHDANDALLAVVRSYGVGEDDQLLAKLTIFASLHGVVLLEASGYLNFAIDPGILFEAIAANSEQLLSACRGPRAA
jgi:AcrR family transcriptional regulator